MKRLLKNDRLRRVLCWLGAGYVRLLHLSSRWEVRGEEIGERFHAEGKPFIGCFWHGRMLMMPFAWRHANLAHMLISHHRDGLLISRVIGHLGIRTVAGSSSRGGASALRQILQILKDGGYVCFTPDGPRGPRMRASIGVVQAARLSGAPVVPASYSVRRGRNLNSWDRFLLPRFFTRGVILWGAPIHVPRDIDDAGLEACRRQIEDSLTALTAEADQLCGRPPILPAEAVAP
ncbi:lysophospholipid acyltransferase family protein [Magnetospira thiophila]